MKAASDIDRVIGTNIRLYRKRCGLSQQILARSVGVSYQQLQKYERGVSRIPASRLYLISRELRVTLDTFFLSDASIVCVSA